LTVMTKKSEALLDQLLAVAGDPAIVEEALKGLNQEAPDPPTLREIIRRILEIKQRRHEMVHATAAAQ
jgi:hypothetical protein